MNQRLSRTEIRRDELVEGLNRSFEFTHDHLRQILIAVAALGALGLAWLGVRSWQGAEDGRASAALAAAQEVYSAAIVAPGEEPPADVTGATFPSVEARRLRAEEMFVALRRDYDGPASDAAAIFLAKIAIDQGDSVRAETLWREVVANDPEGLLAAPARLDLIRLQRSQGKGEEALRTLEEMLRDENRQLPDDVVLFELAVTLQALDRPAEARPYLQRILDEFPRSSYRNSAQQEISSLPPSAA